MISPRARVSLGAAFVSIVAAFGPDRHSPARLQQEESAYDWNLALGRGKGCFDVDCEEGDWPLAHHPVVAFGGALWMIGQGKAHGWSWKSNDGATWIRNRSDAGWGERYGMTAAFVNGQLWMMGGTQVRNDAFRNDVWASRDGSHWRLVTARAGWSPRRWHATLSYRGKLWVLGGNDGRDLNDVWASADGVRWDRVTAKAPWSPRTSPVSLVFQNKMWVIGGGGWDSPKNDVWSSADGKDWTRVAEHAGWPPRPHAGGAVWDGKLWLVGGFQSNDVWCSSDGLIKPATK